MQTIFQIQFSNKQEDKNNNKFLKFGAKQFKSGFQLDDLNEIIQVSKQIAK
ncbi:hypothetical protein TTHERM_00705100 (macronuclear) [Tetrahymena thermophila SB210]|uniref:Uncharacterized protein n=1 Tax=Tetrahymena thermophila (strain SB210) TaxID=312017 RepID=I7M775_TETTS|nr:hypothetical protein TTHERM_00705100 [Tetrahymena thermophila SB210]EAR90694.1 hypothetical protein TTHERM_00705100 [Tetrahymena thermophila SB210]|eukprot:XP_001010939.1 hypothetical protein TTHERM_00705100 [Tetrahymena thermophila SB210]